MGQRLNIQIEANDTDTNETKVLANCYYQWSGYTSSAMELVNEMVNSGIYHLDILDPVEKAIRLLEATGAGLTEDELTDTYNTPKYNLATSRNDGLIAISERGINDTVAWEELRVTINLTTGSINITDMVYDETDEFSSDEADLNSSFDTFQTLYAELNDNVYNNSSEQDMLI